MLLVLALSAAALPTPFFGPATPAEAATRTYYLDCNSGSDSNSGLGTGSAWRSLNKANNASLAPGDSLLLKRDCTWTGTLKARWRGSANARITISAYGSGALPKIQNSSSDLSNGQTYTSVDITGSYLTIQYLQTTVVNPPVSSGCRNNPIGFFVGFNFRNPDNTANGGSYNILRYSRATHAMAGVHFNNNTHHDQVLHNTLTDNNVMNVLTPRSFNAYDDIGAWGIVLKGQHQEIAYNYLARNNAFCTYDTPPQGNSIEVFEAQDSVIHHNTAYGDRVFSELGGSSGNRVDGLTYAYNLVVSGVRDARFIVTRGGDNPFGPTYRVKLYNNTVYFTGAESQGIICGAGCGTNILTAVNNVIWAEGKAVYTDGPITENHNIYWNTAGTPFVQFSGFTLNNSSMLRNPRFMSISNRNFRLQSTSPAINVGALTSWTTDLDGRVVPQSITDLGGYEYGSSSASIAAEVTLSFADPDLPPDIDAPADPNWPTNDPEAPAGPDQPSDPTNTYPPRLYLPLVANGP
jgi:hypothetical protein